MKKMEEHILVILDCWSGVVCEMEFQFCAVINVENKIKSPLINDNSPIYKI